MNNQKNSLRLSASAGKSTRHPTRIAPAHPPRIPPPHAAVKQELHDAITKAKSPLASADGCHRAGASPSWCSVVPGKMVRLPRTASTSMPTTALVLVSPESRSPASPNTRFAGHFRRPNLGNCPKTGQRLPSGGRFGSDFPPTC